MKFHLAAIIIGKQCHWSQTIYGERSSDEVLRLTARDARIDVGDELLPHLKIYGPFAFETDQPVASWRG